MALLPWLLAGLVLVVTCVVAASKRLDEILDDEEDREW